MKRHCEKCSNIKEEFHEIFYQHTAVSARNVQILLLGEIKNESRTILAC